MKRICTRRLYYMHPINTYNTALEHEQMVHLARFFYGWDIVNPNQEKHCKAYEKMKAETGNGMPYFVELAASCQAGAALAFRDGKFGAGVFKEMMPFFENNYPVWEITLDNQLLPLRESELQAIQHTRVLSVEQTKKRVYNTDKTLKPY